VTTTKSDGGWMAPRGGGYRPGKNTATPSPSPTGTAKSAKPPAGGAGVSKAGGRG
jgi:hypothetical protein